MYHPYFRGKLNELIAIRETAELLAAREFVPIIEPVKEALNGVERTLDAVIKAKGRAVVIVNPFHGDYSDDGESITNLLAERFEHDEKVLAGILLKGDMSAADVDDLRKAHDKNPLAFVHAGFSDAKGLAKLLESDSKDILQVFFEPDCGTLYQKRFPVPPRVLIRDGFQRRKNREHPTKEFFSDLHATFDYVNMTGFGDFLIVGDDYSETGGPAYAVAIHITFIDPSKDDAMYVYHFVSDSQDTPKDPAGKFGEALTKLIKKLGQPGSSKILESRAIKEFRDLHARRHFPGLGYIKKLSMQHHIETLADYFA